jgi:hypothetical protein
MNERPVVRWYKNTLLWRATGFFYIYNASTAVCFTCLQNIYGYSNCIFPIFLYIKFYLHGTMIDALLV